MGVLSFMSMLLLAGPLTFRQTISAGVISGHLMEADDTFGLNRVLSKVLPMVGFSSSDSHIIFTDGNTREYLSLSLELSTGKIFRGVALFNAKASSDSSGIQLNNLTTTAREVRTASLGVNIVVLSDAMAFLKEFLTSSLENRLLADITRLIIMGRLDLEDVQDLSSYWTVSVMNTQFLIPRTSKRWDVYTFMPFTPDGRRLIRLASWSLSKGLVKRSALPFFPPKFSNMHGGSVSISALHYEPYWIEDRDKEGSVIYSGTDRLMLEAMAATLNFSISLLPVRTWDEVFQSVSNRSSWVAPIIHFVLPGRLETAAFTWNYDGNPLAFAFVKPLLEPKWQSLYYPLSNEVWILVVGTVVVASWSFIIIIRVSRKGLFLKKSDTGLVILQVFAALLAQGLNDRLLVASSFKIILTFWLMFSFIVGTVYKGNLVASLVAPRFPPRPETLEELVRDVEKVTIPPYGHTFLGELQTSEVESLRALGNMMLVGIDIEEGLELALRNGYPHLESLRFLQHQIAVHHTEADGSSPFYIGREGAMSGVYAWPIPHDAPFKENFDFVILSLVEGGFYNKWIHNWLEDAERLGRQKNRQELTGAQLADGKLDLKLLTSAGGDDTKPKSLTLVHFQGPLLILAVGINFAAVVFLTEYRM